MWRRVDIVLTDGSEERIASIFRTEEKRRNPLANQKRRLTQYLHGAISLETTFFIVTAVKSQILHKVICNFMCM
jgi:hypothetical protein